MPRECVQHFVMPTISQSKRPRRPSSARPRWAALRAGAWAVLVALLLLSPAGDGPPPWPFAEQLRALAERGGDKVVHGALFAVQAWLLCRVRRTGGIGWPLLCFALATAYGALTELGQLLVDGRDAGIADAAANTAGAMLGAAIHARDAQGARGAAAGGGPAGTR